jgi:hypothetical protein
MLFALIVGALAATPCPLDELDGVLDAADTAEQVPKTVRTEITAALRCADTPPDAPRLARAHRVLARLAVQEGDLDLAARHRLASFEAAPLDTPLPAGDERATYVALQERTFAMVPTPVRVPEGSRVDGQPASWHRSDLPAFVQLPERPTRLVGPSRAGERIGGSGGKATLRWAGLAAGVVAGGLYGGAWAARGAYLDAVATDADDAARKSAHAWNRGLSVASVGALGIGGVLVSVSL